MKVKKTRKTSKAIITVNTKVMISKKNIQMMNLKQNNLLKKLMKTNKKIKKKKSINKK